MLAKSKTRLAEAAGLLAMALALTACGSGGGSSNSGQSNSSLVDTGQAQNGTPSAATKTANTRSTATDAATATPGPGAANVKLSSNQATLGNLALTLSVDTAHRMVTPNAPAAAPTPQGQQGNQNQGGPAAQDMVLGSQTQQISKNLDASQGPPPDPKEAQGDFIRHVAIQVKDKNTGQVVPYLVISVDLLRDGRPVQYDQPLVAMVPAGGSADQMHYGNNMAFPGKGNYQLFVRIAPSALIGNSAPPTAQFDVSIE